MACKLNIKADNGNNSILFKDIVDSGATTEEAVDIYYYTKTDAFKQAYDQIATDKTKDDNGEVKFSAFSDSPITDDVERAKIEEDSRAKVYKNLIKAVPAITKIIDDKIAYYTKFEKKSNQEHIAKLKEAKELLENRTINESVPRFLSMANEHLKVLNVQSAAELRKSDSDIKRLASLNKMAQGYNVIKQLDTSLLSHRDLDAIFEGENLPINNSLGNIHSINSRYIEKSMEYLADEITARLPHKDRKTVLAEIKHAARDQDYIEQMGRYMGDSGDILLAGVAVIIKEAEHQITREGNEIARDLQVVTEKMEAKYSAKEIEQALVYQKDNGEMHILDIEAVEGEQYDKVQALKNSKPEMYDFLVFFSNTYGDLKKMISDGNGMGTRLPTVLKKDLERLKGNNLKDTMGLIQDDMSKAIMRSNLDMERGAILDGSGKPVKRVPAFYQQRYDSRDLEKEQTRLEKKYLAEGMTADEAEARAEVEAEAFAVRETAKFISTDLPSSLMSYASMALNFGHKNSIVPIMESAKDVAASDKRVYTKLNSGGMRTKAINKGNEFETISGEASRAAKILEQAIDVQVYGQKEKDLGYADTIVGKVDYNSVIRKATKYTGYVQMGMNFMAGIANATMGGYSNIMEAIGGEYYTTKDYRKASKMYFGNMGGIMADIGARTPKNIVNLLDQHYNILQDFSINEIKTTERSKASRLLKLNSIFFMSAAGEHSVQGRAGLAMLENTKMFDKEGNSKGSLLENHKLVDGKLKIPSNLYVKGADGKMQKFNTNQQNRIANKIGAVNRKAQGNYSSKTATGMQQDARTAMIAKFRGWVVEGFAKRWGATKESHLLENNVEGFYRTGGSVAKNIFRDASRMRFDLAKENWTKLSPHEKANVRRFVTEFSMIALTSTAAALLGGAGKMMEDKFGSDKLTDRIALGTYLMTVYQVNRLYTEISAYINPMETVRLMRSPFATLSILENTLSLLAQAGFAPTEEYETGYRKGQNKALVKAGKLIPFYKQLETLNPDGIKERTKYFN